MINKTSIDASRVISDLADIGIKPHEYSKPIYKYTSVETAKIILETLKIRFRAPSTFNDPFEFSLEFFDKNLTNKEFKSSFDSVLKLQPEITSKQRKELLRTTSIAALKKNHDSIIEKQRHISMVFCSSEINNDILMWSHYANSHKGVCIGLFLPSLIPKLGCITLKVNYTDKIEPKRFYTNDDHQKGLAFTYWAFTKAACWSYEKEVRSFIMEPNQSMINKDRSFDVQLNNSLIAEIYFGLETSEKDINDLKEIINRKGYSISIKKMKKIKGMFGIHAV